MRRMVVGVHDERCSAAALRWAARAAAEAHAELEVLSAYDPSGAEGPRRRDEAEERQRRMIAAEVDLARLAVPLRAETVPGDAAEVLCGRAIGAELLVLGRRPRRRLLPFPYRSVSLRCVERAACPVVVVRGDLVGPAVPPPG